MNSYFLEKNLLFGKKYPIYYTEGLNCGGIIWNGWMKDYSFPKVNSIMEMCSGPGFMGYYLKHKYNIPKLILVDIYEPLKEYIDRTNKENEWEDEVTFYLSDGFKQYDGPKVDMIVSNPPHYVYEKDFLSLKTIQPRVDERKFYDKDFSFHKDFLQGIDDVLNKDGYLILYENKTQIPPELIMKTNPRLELIDYMEHIESRYTGVFKFT